MRKTFCSCVLHQTNRAISREGLASRQPAEVLSNAVVSCLLPVLCSSYGRHQQVHQPHISQSHRHSHNTSPQKKKTCKYNCSAVCYAARPHFSRKHCIDTGRQGHCCLLLRCYVLHYTLLSVQQYFFLRFVSYAT